MKLWFRFGLYLGGGGLVIMWIDPPRGLGQHLLILALIVGASYLDYWLFQSRPSYSKGGNIVSLADLRHARNRRQGTGGMSRERRVLQMVFSTRVQGEVEDLLDMLRAEGLNPMMVSQGGGMGQNGTVFEVRLPEKEVQKAKPLIQFFVVKSAKTPS